MRMPQALRRIVVYVLFGCVLAAVGVSPAAASFDSPHARVGQPAHAMNKKQRKLCREAKSVRKSVIKKYTKLYTEQYGKKKGKKKGKREPGRDICVLGNRDGSTPPAPKLSDYLAVLHRKLTPPPARVTTSSPSTGAGASSSGSTASGILPACASESGTNYSTGPDNTNASGATGRYQEMPEHRQPGGLCYGIDLSPAGQDKCAVIIYKDQGSGAWTNCGG
jgi:hypothetical protein